MICSNGVPATSIRETVARIIPGDPLTTTSWSAHAPYLVTASARVPCSTPSWSDSASSMGTTVSHGLLEASLSKVLQIVEVKKQPAAVEQVHLRDAVRGVVALAEFVDFPAGVECVRDVRRRL